MSTRREFITLLGGAAAAWPLAARAQHRTRRIGVLMPFGSNDSEGQARVAVFRDGLAQLGWIEGQNLHIDYRWADDPLTQLQPYALELVERMPDAILASSTAPVAALVQATRTISDRIRPSVRSRSTGFCCKLGASRRQRNRIHKFRSRYAREMAGAGQRPRPANDAGAPVIPSRDDVS